MGRHFFIVFFCIKTMFSFSFLFYHIYLKGPPPLPNLNLEQWWGDGPRREDTSVRDFKIKFDSQMIRDLKDRLKSHRPWTPPLEDAAFNYGFNSEQLEPWLKYLNDQYPFAEREKFLNQFPQYKTNIQGLDLHFIRVKPEVNQISEGVEVVPLLLLHGWPGSVREFYETIPHLTAVSKDRDFALELIIPSLPGFGYSDATFRPGLGAAEVAIVLRNLMHRIGFRHYYLQGGDWGAIIGSIMATLFPKEILGFHNNMAITMSPAATYVSILGAAYPKLLVDEGLIDCMYPLKKFYMFLLEQTGYLHLQASKPDIIGLALSNSPVGHLAYILDLFKDSDLNLKDGGLTDRFTRDQPLDNFMIYWSSESITSSMRLYAETFNKRYLEMKIDEIPTSVPTWVLQAKYEFAYQPPYLLRFKYENLLNCTVLNRGGHFIALELPEIFAEDVLKAISQFRKWHRENDDVFVKEEL